MRFLSCPSQSLKVEGLKQAGQELAVEHLPSSYWELEQIPPCSSPEQPAVERGKSFLSFVKLLKYFSASDLIALEDSQGLLWELPSMLLQSCSAMPYVWLFSLQQVGTYM